MTQSRPGSRPRTVNRREVIAALTSLGIGTGAFHQAIAADSESGGTVTPEMVQHAEWLAGIELNEDERKAVAEAVKGDQQKIAALRKVEIGYDVPPALTFYAAPPQAGGGDIRRGDVHPIEIAAPERPQSDDDLAFLPVTELSALIRTRKVSSVELTKLYLARLKRFNDLLKCVVTLTEDVAHEQAERADREIAAGRYRGPLARHSLGRERPHLLARLQDHLGRRRFSGTNARRQSHRRRAAGRRRRGARRQAHTRRAGPRRRVVRRPDAQSLEPRRRLERLIGRLRVRCRRRPRRLCDRQRNARQHRLALPPLQRDTACGPPLAASAATAA